MGWERFLKSVTRVLIGGFLGALVGVVTGFPAGITILMGMALMGMALMGMALMGTVMCVMPRYRFYREVDQGVEPNRFFEEPLQTHAYRLFLTTTFRVMGYLAQVRGCSEADASQAAGVIMGHLRLTERQQQQAICLLKEGRQPNFAIDPVLSQFYSACQHHAHFIRQFIEIQMSVFYANGFPSPHERAILLHICSQLGFARRFEDMEAYIKRRFHRSSKGTYTGQENRKRQRKPVSLVHLHRAYGILGLSRHATNTEVKKAYRRLINRHHPDKLEAQNTSTENLQRATEKTRVVKEAYELIKQYRRM